MEVSTVVVEDETVKSIEIDDVSGEVGGGVEDEVG